MPDRFFILVFSTSKKAFCCEASRQLLVHSNHYLSQRVWTARTETKQPRQARICASTQNSVKLKLLVEQNEPFVERYSKQAQGWLLSDFNGLERSISLSSVGIELPMVEIYRSVVFE